MAIIKQILDKLGNVLYPQTSTKAVYSEDGTRLDVTLGSITEDVKGLKNEKKVLATAQTLTDEEKSQAQTNIGVKNTVDVVGVGEKANIQLTVWKENSLRKFNGGGIDTDASYILSNTIRVNRGDKITISLFGTTAVSLISEVINNEEHAFIRTILQGNGSTDERYIIADKDMWIEICCPKTTYNQGFFITPIKLTNNYLPIPNGGYMRDLFVAAGATYNEETGFYELNGLTDITESEMADVFNTLNLDFVASTFEARYAYNKARTNIVNPFRNNLGLEVKCQHMARNSNFEIFVMPMSKVVKFSYLHQAFYSCENLRKIIGEINLADIHYFNATFSGCYKLEEVFLKGINADSLSFSQNPLINYNSIKYLVDNSANDRAITITVHQTTYGYLTGTTEPTEQVGGTTEEWQQILTDAQSKQISFATTD